MKPKDILWSVGGVLGLLVLIVLAWPGIASYHRPNRGLWVQNLYAQLSIASRAYKQEYGTYPESSENKAVIAALTGDNPRKIVFFEPQRKQLNEQKEILDGWGTPIRIAFPSDELPSFLSAGKDKVFGTPDDIKDKR
jgi:hypothetical protein